MKSNTRTLRNQEGSHLQGVTSQQHEQSPEYQTGPGTVLLTCMSMAQEIRLYPWLWTPKPINREARSGDDFMRRHTCHAANHTSYAMQTTACYPASNKTV